MPPVVGARVSNGVVVDVVTFPVSSTSGIGNTAVVPPVGASVGEGLEPTT